MGFNTPILHTLDEINNYEHKSKHVVPLLINELGETVFNYNHARFILVKFGLVTDSDRRLFYNLYHYELINGQYVYGFKKLLGNSYCFYADLNNLTRSFRKTNCLIGNIYSGNYRVNWDGSSIDKFYSNIKEYGNYNKDYVIYNKMFKNEKISQKHHTHIRLEKLINIIYRTKGYDREYLLKNKIIEYDIIKKHKINRIVLRHDILGNKYYTALVNLFRLGYDTETVYTTIFLFISLAENISSNLLTKILVMSKNKEEFESWLKIEGMIAKQQQGLYRSDLNHCFELQVLLNRRSISVNWDEEILNRTKPVTVSVPKEFVYRHACNIFATALCEGKKFERMTWDEYWNLRYSLQPMGSVHSQYIDDIAIINSIPREARNKTVVLSSMSYRKLDMWLTRPPCIVAHTSTKYEWSKSRAVYGCDLTSHIITDFAMRNSEDMLPSYFPVGKDAEENKVLRTAKRLADLIPFCYDYDDFNSQHSFDSMESVIDAYIAVSRGYISNEQYRALQWVKKSIRDQKFTINDTNSHLYGNVYRSEGTLFSGWRLTAFMNSVLNRIYLLYAKLQDNCVYALHNGDDVLMGCEYIKDVFTIISNADSVGIRSQINKICVGSIGEFLRMDTFSTDNSRVQYLTRGCATACHGRIETSINYSVPESLEMFIERGNILLSRGGKPEVVRHLTRDCMVNVIERLGGDFEVIDKYVSLHRIQGGILNNAYLSDSRLKKYYEKPVEINNIRVAVEKMSTGINDYFNYIGKKLNINIGQQYTNRMVNECYRLFKRDIVKLKIISEDRKDIYAKYYIYKSWRKHIKVATSISKVRLLGSYNVTNINRASMYLTNYLKSVKNPMKVLKNIF